MQLREPDAEALPDRHHDLGEEGRAVRREEPVQGPAELIIAHAGLGRRGEPVEAGGERAKRLALPVDGLPLHDDRPQQDPEPVGVRHGDPPVVGRDVPRQGRRQVQAGQEVIHQGQRPQPLRAEREPGPSGSLCLRARQAGAILSARL